MDGIVNASLRSRLLVSGFRVNPPLVKPSRLTSRNAGGVGKELSNGWAVNFAVGCSFGCPFCYVDYIWKGYGRAKFGPVVDLKWGDYLLLPSNLDEAIKATPWERWSDVEVLMSSTHDPFLPQLVEGAMRILEAALPRGVRFCIQTRSPLAARSIPLLSRYREQVRLQVSVATMDRQFSRLIEPRVAPPESRLNLLRKAKEAGLRVGVIIAPVFPPVPQRPDWRSDMEEIFRQLSAIEPDFVYGESLHIRGMNVVYLKEVLGVEIGHKGLSKFDWETGRWFEELAGRYKLRGTWWHEYGRGSGGVVDNRRDHMASTTS
jgi:DNA repair photolyase